MSKQNESFLSRVPVRLGYKKMGIAIVSLVLVALPFFVSLSQLYLMTLALVFGILAFSAIIPIGYAEELILAQGALFGVGAYTYVMTVQRGVPTWIALVLAIAGGAVAAYILGRPSLRAHGIYLGIITLAFNEIFVIALDLYPNIFGGSKGFTAQNLAFPEFLTNAIPIEGVYYYLILIVYAGVLVLMSRSLSGDFGGTLFALQENEEVAGSIGINVFRYRLYTFVITGALCGLAGGLYAPLNGYIAPTMFDLSATVDIILAGVVGGITIPAGSFIGGLFVTFPPEYLRFISDIRLFVYGTALLVLLIYLPEGLGGWLRNRF
ncbi:branched-chain amino acid ABC transporter permease [Halovenus marina]|uniref:branched-chain amino acid ABC transporter permease n=1 Tax=Halovenus marina TaxID=3396621 RepID=UPI003F56A449